MIRIVPERPEHRTQILALNREAFDGDAEAEIVERLSAADLGVASLVALAGEGVVGHILFSRLDVEVDGRRIDAVSLAPMAVAPSHQRQGIGTRLVAGGLAALRGKRIAAVIVLGHPELYGRFGFSAEIVNHISSPFQYHPGFMGLELQPEALAGVSGRCRYPAAFGLAD